MEVENVNMKKLFPEKKMSKKGLIEFLDKKGFYIVLILCVAIVGATAVFVTTHNLTSSDINFDARSIIPDEIADNPPQNVEGTASVQSSTNTSAADPEKVVAANTAPTDKNVGNKQTTPQKQDEKQSAPKPTAKKSSTPVTNQKFIMPVFGEITFDYATDKLVYSKTLEDWRTHSGIDIAAEKGAPVKVVADGVVSEIKDDPRLGIIIIVDHNSGIQTVYANLLSDEMVVPNQKVEQGDLIGAVGNTANFESAEQSHLHFEVLKNVDPVNPSTYLPKK